MKPEIIVVGSSNTDMVVKTDHLPAKGETVIGTDFMIAPGGKGANQAVAAARAGGKVHFIAKIGNDVFGKQTVKGFIKDKINTKFIYIDKEVSSGIALILVDKRGQNSIAVAPGANSNLSPRDILNASKIFSNAKVLLVQLEIPLETVRTAIDLGCKNNLTVILNPAPATKLPHEFYQKISIITPNESETRILTGIKPNSSKNLILAAEKLLRNGVKTVIITLGEKGAFIHSKTISTFIPTYKVKPVDTTAAGDVFNGALAVAIAEGLELLEAVQFANAAAAISVTRPGAQPSAPFRNEILKMLECGKTSV